LEAALGSALLFFGGKARRFPMARDAHFERWLQVRGHSSRRLSAPEELFLWRCYQAETRVDANPVEEASLAETFQSVDQSVPFANDCARAERTELASPKATGPDEFSYAPPSPIPQPALASPTDAKCSAQVAETEPGLLASLGDPPTSSNPNELQRPDGSLFEPSGYSIPKRVDKGACLGCLVCLLFYGWWIPFAIWDLCVARPTLEVEPPVASMRFDGSVAVVHLVPGAKLGDSVAIDVFQGAFPGMQDDDRPKCFGDEIQGEYWCKGSRLVFDRDPDSRRGELNLTVFPSTLHRDKFFCDQISKHLSERLTTSVELSILAPDGDVTAELVVHLDGVRVHEVVWYRHIRPRRDDWGD
jgi:hypothetical protein